MDGEKEEREAKLTEQKTRGGGGSEVTGDAVERTGLSGGVCCGGAVAAP
jgi:hypothetical protein